MIEKFDKAVDAIVDKTKNGKISWERADANTLNKNRFYRKYVNDNQIDFDGINNYMAEYGDGYIFLSNQSFGYKEIAIQPRKNSDITVLSSGTSIKMKKLEALVKENLDNPDDFIDSLFD